MRDCDQDLSGKTLNFGEGNYITFCFEIININTQQSFIQKLDNIIYQDQFDIISNDQIRIFINPPESALRWEFLLPQNWWNPQKDRNLYLGIIFDVEVQFSIIIDSSDNEVFSRFFL